MKVLDDGYYTVEGTVVATNDDTELMQKVDVIPRERIEQMKNEFIHIGEGSGWIDISLSHCLEIIDKYTKEQNNETNRC